MTCKHCQQPLSDCKYPISHSHPTIDTIELPASIRAIGNKTPGQYTSRDIAALNEYVT